jgi:hypothetical protein
MDPKIAPELMMTLTTVAEFHAEACGAIYAGGSVRICVTVVNGVCYRSVSIGLWVQGLDLLLLHLCLPACAIDFRLS